MLQDSLLWRRLLEAALDVAGPADRIDVQDGGYGVSIATRGTLVLLQARRTRVDGSGDTENSNSVVLVVR